MTELNILEIKISEKALQELITLKEQLNTPSLTETIRRSLALLIFLHKATKKGDKLILRRGRQERELFRIID